MVSNIDHGFNSALEQDLMIEQPHNNVTTNMYNNIIYFRLIYNLTHLRMGSK